MPLLDDEVFANFVACEKVQQVSTSEGFKLLDP